MYPLAPITTAFMNGSPFTMMDVRRAPVAEPPTPPPRARRPVLRSPQNRPAVYASIGASRAAENNPEERRFTATLHWVDNGQS